MYSILLLFVILTKFVKSNNVSEEQLLNIYEKSVTDEMSKNNFKSSKK